MKCLKITYAIIFVVLFLLIDNGVCSAQERGKASAESEIYDMARSNTALPQTPLYNNVYKGNLPIAADPVEVSLLTCDPSEEVYGLYGHTALRYHNRETGEDWAFNYGIFNFQKPFFVLRFALGKTDYELGVTTFSFFKRSYAARGVRVREQVLNLTPEEKSRLYNALCVNYLPENKVYRYNCYYDNCTTRARDMIERCIVDGEISYDFSDVADKEGSTSYRSLIHASNNGHPWAAFGVDLCMGIGSDIDIDYRQMEFLPRVTLEHFDKASIVYGDTVKPLVSLTRVAVAGDNRPVEKEFPLSPSQCAVVFLILSVVIALCERKLKRIFTPWDVFLMLVQGLAGILIVLLFLSEHPTTSTNLQILILNPLPFFFLPSVIGEGKRNSKGVIRRRSIYWTLSASFIVLFFIGTFFQDYAEGMLLVALSLLTRCWSHFTIVK